MTDQADNHTLADVIRAVAFAADKHRAQVRSGPAEDSYILHPLDVAQLTAEATGGDPTVTIAAILHDTLEDTETSYDELAQEFGRTVADLVRENTDDPALSKREQKAAQEADMPGNSRAARIIKMADKCSNTRYLARKPPDWRRERIVRYAQGNRRVVEAARGTSPYLERIWDDMWPELCAELGIEQ